MLPMYNAGVDRFYRSNLASAFRAQNCSVEHFLCSFLLGWSLKRRSHAHLRLAHHQAIATHMAAEALLRRMAPFLTQFKGESP